ncbi:hypothetical protein [Desulfosporosinus sp. Sb-LF]|uniref:hypothetical protein n=1 Tax=Desulfosporosinus sp. Sb-LF TaxID=2560027 RepID=UPI00107FBE3F|nr:hypothetical protein [Desulfosporosinus sp. Sb-LF]TGE34473.1 hypothetical protein E4K68_01945 [Desulfosporosinus sp. Sb-LF]
MKNRNLLFVSLLIVLVLNISGCAQTSPSKATQAKTDEVIANEKAYQQLVKEIETTDWGKAEPKEWEDVQNSINELITYRDTPMIARYISYLKYLKENKVDNAIGVANNIPADYFGDLKDEIKKIKSEAKTLAKAQDMKYYEELIRRGDYETLRAKTVEKVSLDADYNAIYSFLSALEYQKKGIRTAMIVSLSHISMPYNGLLSEEITKMVNQNADEVTHMRNLLSGKTSTGKPKPYIGMTTNEVLASSWGSPDGIITTMTIAGKQEQWEYAADKVIFIENGFVTAIV